MVIYGTVGSVRLSDAVLFDEFAVHYSREAMLELRGSRTTTGVPIFARL